MTVTRADETCPGRKHLLIGGNAYQRLIARVICPGRCLVRTAEFDLGVALVTQNGVGV